MSCLNFFLKVWQGLVLGGGGMGFHLKITFSRCPTTFALAIGLFWKLLKNLDKIWENLSMTKTQMKKKDIYRDARHPKTQNETMNESNKIFV